MKYCSAKRRKHIGVILGDVQDEEIPIYEVDFYSHYRIMFPFYTFLNATSGWCLKERGMLAQAWSLIPSCHKLGNEIGHHDEDSLIDYIATALITFDSPKRRSAQQWWRLILDRYMMAYYPKFQDCSEKPLWTTINGALSLIGYVPSAIYGGDLKAGDKNAYRILHYLRDECRKLTKSIKVRDSALSSGNPFENEIFLFNEGMKLFLIAKGAIFMKRHSRSDNSKFLLRDS